MYAKFSFYSVAQMYAFGLKEPVAILLGRDNLYWVVDQIRVSGYLNDGCSLLSSTPGERFASVNRPSPFTHPPDRRNDCLGTRDGCCS